MVNINLFIVGGPKCGSTSVHRWISGHEKVYMSPRKEPHYYAADLDLRNKASSREYYKLFGGVKEGHDIVGESSTTYMYSSVAIDLIEKKHDEPKYIALLRDPVTMAYSLHDTLTPERECVEEFDTAWRLSPERRNGNHVPPQCDEPLMLDYQSFCKLGEQVRRLITKTDRDRVLCLFLEDLKQSPVNEYKRILRFLNLSYNGRSEFPVHNRASESRLQIVEKCLAALRSTIPAIKSRLGIPLHVRSHVLSRLSEMNRRERTRKPLPQRLRKQLTEYYYEDIKTLEKVCKRDLSSWYSE